MDHLPIEPQRGSSDPTESGSSVPNATFISLKGNGIDCSSERQDRNFGRDA